MDHWKWLICDRCNIFKEGVFEVFSQSTLNPMTACIAARFQIHAKDSALTLIICFGEAVVKRAKEAARTLSSFCDMGRQESHFDMKKRHDVHCELLRGSNFQFVVGYLDGGLAMLPTLRR